MAESNRELIQHITEAIRASKIWDLPFRHLMLKDIFPPGVYADVLDRWPTEEWEELVHPDQKKPDGTYRRKQQAVELAFPELADALKSPEVRDALFETLGQKNPGRAFPIPLLLDDEPGYWIRPHPDTPIKILTTQIYFAEDEANLGMGTRMIDKPPKASFHHVPYRPNSGFAFLVSPLSWHEVKPDYCTERRRSLQLIYYNSEKPQINYK